MKNLPGYTIMFITLESEILQRWGQLKHKIPSVMIDLSVLHKPKPTSQSPMNVLAHPQLALQIKQIHCSWGKRDIYDITFQLLLSFNNLRFSRISGMHVGKVSRGTKEGYCQRNRFLSSLLFHFWKEDNCPACKMSRWTFMLCECYLHEKAFITLR